MPLTQVSPSLLDSNAQTLSFKNRIINGDMRIDQRNAGAAVTPIDGQMLVDRWKYISTQSGKFTVQQNAGSVTPPAGFTNYLGATSTSAYSLLASDNFNVEHRLEGFNISDFGFGTANAQPVTVSFRVRSSLVGTHCVALTNDGARWCPVAYTISAANTWETKTVTFPGDTSGTWNTTNGLGMILRFSMGTGSNFFSASGVWTSSNVYGISGQVNVVSTNGATFYLTGVQLEAGSQPTAFERRSYGTELALCQRYYQTVMSSAIINTPFAGRSAGTTSIVFSCPLVTTMRSTPTVTGGQMNAYSGGARVTATSGTLTANANTGQFDTTLNITATGFTGLTDDRIYNVNSSTATTMTLSSEL